MTAVSTRQSTSFPASTSPSCKRGYRHSRRMQREKDTLWIVVADDSLERDCEDILDGSLEGILDGSSNVPSTMPSQSPSKMPSQSPFKEPVATDEWVSYKTEMDNDDGCSDGAIVGCDSNRQVGPKSETEEDEIKKSAKRIVVRSTMCALVGKQGYRDYALCCESA